MKNVKNILFSIFLLQVTAFTAFADGGVSTDYSPYSKYGIGIRGRQGTAVTRNMGGIGVAYRDNKTLNIMNPAAVTARDSLAFMADISLNEDNIFMSQGSQKSVHNNFNICDIAFSFPIWRSSAFMVGIVPYSSIGYDFNSYESDYNVIGQTGNITNKFSGTGSLYQAFIGAGATFWKRLSIGAQFNFIFGNLDRASSRTFSSSSYKSIYTDNQMAITGCNGKFGLQYEQPFGKKHRLVLGGTYTLSTKLGGHGENVSYSLQSEVADTIYFKQLNLGGVTLPQEYSVGINYTYGNKFKIEFDYARSDWRKSQMDNIEGFSLSNFSSSVAQRFNAGMEYTPNRNDIRYYMKRVTYMIGGYYTDEHFRYCDKKISSYGITFGMTLPVFRWHNGITVGAELGRRGNLSEVKENYVNFTIGFNIFDIWFLKHKYE